MLVLTKKTILLTWHTKVIEAHTYLIFCTGSVWRRAGAALQCWQGPASRAACSGAQHYHSHQSGTLCVPAQLNL